MTEQIYYDDSYLSEFYATVLGVENTDNNTAAIILNATAFFPEGGGQSADTGYIGNAFVFDVAEKDGIIYHFTKDKDLPEVGAIIPCRIDAGKRFLRMQAHSGEHIVSGIAHSMYGAENVGFHMDDTVMTVDFNIPLSDEQLRVIEMKANDCIYQNVNI